MVSFLPFLRPLVAGRLRALMAVRKTIDIIDSNRSSIIYGYYFFVCDEDHSARRKIINNELPNSSDAVKSAHNTLTQ